MKSILYHQVKIIFIELGHNSMPVLELITPVNKKSKVDIKKNKQLEWDMIDE